MIAVRTYELPFREINMLRLIAFALAAYCYLQSGFAMADEAAKQLVGSWRLIHGLSRSWDALRQGRLRWRAKA